ncbi:MAG: hypothetical protein H6Q72_4161 [Firmicutes bacterium]|nr:hypothetical protein [Bacillota bacterium]
MSETKDKATAEINSTADLTNTNLQEGPDIDNATAVNQTSGLDNTQDGLRTGDLKLGNKHAASSLVARMLWGHEEKVSLNARVSEDGSLDLNDDIR